jgi:voltage-gated potassium channel Kch
MSMGMSIELALLFTYPLVSIGLVLLLLLTKAALLWPLARLFGHQGRIALAISFLLAQSGEFALVIFAVAFKGALLDEGLFQQLLLVVVLSMLATPPLAQLAYRLAASRRGEPREEAFAEEAVASTSIVIAGFGRVGRRVGAIFELRNVPYVAVDIDASLVKRERSAGRSVFYGDARQPEVLKSLGVGEAGLIIVTVDDFHAMEQVVSSLHRAFPKLDILARGHDMDHCQNLREHGASLAVSENLEASIALAQAALAKVKRDDVENDVAIDRFRKGYYSDTTGKG